MMRPQRLSLKEPAREGIVSLLKDESNNTPHHRRTLGLHEAGAMKLAARHGGRR
jgi:hypothetical protein